MAFIEGSERPDEVIIYSAHWDHFGIGEPLNGDSIYNGAVDNGTSLAWMFEIAEAFTALKHKPKRSVAFFAPTAEENGLVGSAYYVQDPVFKLAKTVANINNDLMLPYGKMRDVMVTGYGQSELEDYVAQAAKMQGRYILPDPNPHTGMYFRSDHFSFAKVGVPSLFCARQLRPFCARQGMDAGKRTGVGLPIIITNQPMNIMKIGFGGGC
jgi:Zn-dependent M28 family amino/carboxypeptidase